MEENVHVIYQININMDGKSNRGGGGGGGGDSTFGLGMITSLFPANHYRHGSAVLRSRGLHYDEATVGMVPTLQ